MILTEYGMFEKNDGTARFSKNQALLKLTDHQNAVLFSTLLFMNRWFLHFDVDLEIELFVFNSLKIRNGIPTIA